MAPTTIDAILLLAFVAGLAAGGYMVARSPTFWFGLGLVAFKAAKPILVRWFVRVFRPLSPEDQKKLDAARRRGDDWDPFRKRPRSHK